MITFLLKMAIKKIIWNFWLWVLKMTQLTQLSSFSLAQNCWVFLHNQLHTIQILLNEKSFVKLAFEVSPNTGDIWKAVCPISFAWSHEHVRSLHIHIRKSAFLSVSCFWSHAKQLFVFDITISQTKENIVNVSRLSSGESLFFIYLKFFLHIC